MTQFTHLHCHSYYSLMDGLNSPKELFQAAKDVGQEAVAITDHGTLSSHREAIEAGRELGIKPILGVEAYISATDRFDRRQVKAREDNTQLYNHLILLAKDAAGLENLNRMSELAWTEGYYYKPRIDRELLDQYGDGLIVLSGCLNGLVSKAIANDDEEEARKWLEFFKDRFGEDFYIEQQAHNPPKITHGLELYADEYGIKQVATSDCHFAKKEDTAIEEAMLVLSTGPKVAPGENYSTTEKMDLLERINTLYPDRPISFEEFNLYIQSREELESDWTDRHPYLFDNTQEIVDKIVGDYPYYEKQDLLPTPPGEITDPNDRLSRMAKLRLTKMGHTGPEYKARIQEELDLIREKNFAPYFLIVADLYQAARKEGILTGPGRGSSAGSLLCYALGITLVDPLDFDLLFFRFLDPTRDDLPDVDMDFPKSKRAWAKNYLRKKYGHVASISTFMFFKDKGVIRDAARVLKVPLVDVDKALEKVETHPARDFFEDFKQANVTEVRAFLQNYPEVMPLAEALRERIRGTGMHAAGMVVSKEPLEKYAPIETRKDPTDKVANRVPVIAVDMGVAEAIGLIKMDLLGLNTLDILSDALDIIKERHGVDFQLPTKKADLVDKAVFEMISAGDTTGLFQADAAPSTALLKEMKVESFEDLVASNALVRPGARNTVGDIYIRRQYGRELVKYPHPDLEPFLKTTYGVIIYQEQVMQTAVELGGMDMADANKLRRIIGKKKDVSEFEAYRDKFVSGAEKKVPRKVAEALFHDFEAHAGYSFNRSHAVCYSLLTYWCAILKIYYPLEFMFALLKNEEDDKKRTALLIEAKRMGLKVLLPHVNKSDVDFTIEGDSIRFGLKAIKFISDKSATNILQHRPFKNYRALQDAAAVKGSGINSRMLGALNRVGAAAFDDNPRTGNEKDNYYEYLNIPQFDIHALPAAVKRSISPLEIYNEEDCFVISALVENIKRGPGWARVEVVDATGKAGIFQNEDTPIEKGQLYFMLVARNRIMEYVKPEEVLAGSSWSGSPFVRYLHADDLGLIPGGPKFVVAFERRFTKARKLMGTIILADEERKMRAALVFPREFGRVWSKVKPGDIADLQFDRTNDGALYVKGIVA